MPSSKVHFSRHGDADAIVTQNIEGEELAQDPYRNRNRKLLISRAPTKAKLQEPAYSEALNQNKIDSQRSRSRESGKQTVRRLWWMVLGVETGREVWGRPSIRIRFAKEQCSMRVERDSNPRPFGRKAINLPMSHPAQRKQ